MSWDEYFIRMCYLVSQKSKDRSTKVGCVIIGQDNEIRSTGFNGFPRGVDDNKEEFHQRPLKYKITEHAERNAIYNAARCGIVLNNCRIYVPWHPCSDCARGIIQCGIKSVILDPNYKMDDGLMKRWEDDIAISKILFLEAKVLTKDADI